ncbi:MAG: late competence development ComFB family protein [Thermosynechococcaceae cyanobacterium]
MSFFQPQTYTNVTELLVKEEIKKQTANLNANWTESLSLSEIIAYALNRLPSRYATSQEGLYRLRQLMQQKLGKQIEATVGEALRVIHKQPRLTTPLRPHEEIVAEEEMAKMALDTLIPQELSA